jgi:sporulation protein YlmC with PRC-barrel domain
MSSYPVLAADTYGDAHGKTATHEMSLTGVPNAKDTLTKAKVVDANGNSVGTVDDVMFDKAGKPSSLKVDVGSFLGVGGKDVAMKASAFKFDSDRKVLVTSMTKDQIKKLPEVKS